MNTNIATNGEALVSPREVPRAIWEKYATRGPRYTSYPTAPIFTESFDREQAHRRWETCADEISLYTHIPYCKRLCLYCGCHMSVAHDRAIATPYVDRLLAEAKLAASAIGSRKRVRQMAMGGGTPNFLLPADMARLHAGLREVFDFPADGERSIEIDSRTFDLDYIDVLLDAGMNRVSLGVQDLDPEVIDRLRKGQDRDHVARIVEAFRARGLSAINFDLMYGLPGQTEETFGHTIDDVIAMRPTRIALFGYAHVPWLKKHQQVLERYGVPEEAERLAVFGTAYEKLTGAGYRPIGMDHFAEPDDELSVAQSAGTLNRNFMGYTTYRGLDLIALGESAISDVAATYIQNDKERKGWEASIDAGRLAWTKGLILSDDDVARRDLIIELFANLNLDVPAYEKRHGLVFGEAYAGELARLADFESDGLVTLSGEQIHVTPLGRVAIRNICMVFDRYLDPTRQRYSKTV
ncbi:oxygen-independent coproporphyrinogen III oxidase [bacterium]|nr:oxygen-independent coproporphyrinogen III oxidase [bacterium]